MRLNSKLTWGLAWTGLAVVLAVPSADYLTGQFGRSGNTAAVITSTTEPVMPAVPAQPSAETPKQVATVTTRVTRTGVTIIPSGTATPGGSSAPVLDPVDRYVKSGKALPDYISGGSPADGTAVAAPAPATAPEEPPTQVAALDPAPVAPMPFPARPAILDRPSTVAPKDPAVIVDESALATGPGDAMPRRLDVDAGPVPPAGISDDWHSIRERRLARFLERNGLVDDGPGSSASITVIQRPQSDYDPDGFYLSDGPNNARSERRARIDEMLGDDSDEDDFTWF
jgi:hypothetical protein